MDLTLAQHIEVNRKAQRNRKAGRTGIRKVTLKLMMLEKVKRQIQRAVKQYKKLLSSIVYHYDVARTAIKANYKKVS